MYERTNELSSQNFLTFTYFGLNSPFCNTGSTICVLDGSFSSFKICTSDSKGSSSKS